MSLFTNPQLYHNMNHVTYQPSDTTFDESLVDLSSPQAPEEEEHQDKRRQTKSTMKEEKVETANASTSGKKKKKNKTKKPSKKSVETDEDADPADEKQADEFRNDHKQESRKKSYKEKSSAKNEDVDDDDDDDDNKEDADEKPTGRSSSKKTKLSKKASPPPVKSSKGDHSPSDATTPSSQNLDVSEPHSPAESQSVQDLSSTAASAADSVFSQLLLESIVQQRSVADFIAGLPDKRGTLMIRFPTTTFQKNWKKRWFTLHGDCLYYYDQEAAIHPAPGLTAGNGRWSHSHGSGAKNDTAIPYQDFKKIEIANFWIIQSDEESASAAMGSGSHTHTQTTSAFGSSSSSSSSTGRVYGGGQPIAGMDVDHHSNTSSPSAAGGDSKSSKFDEIFKNQQKTESRMTFKQRLTNHNIGSDVSVRKKDPSKEKESGPVVRGRRRSSLVNERGSVVILLMPKDKREDPIELTGLNEGSLADLSILNEWVLAINARICLVNFLQSPMTLTAMARGGRELLAFLTDSSATELKVQNKFSDLETVLTHFKEPLSHRTNIRIIFKNCAMTDSALIALADILKESRNMVIELLDVSSNVLTKASMKALHDALKSNKNIKRLILDSNQLGDEGLDILVNGTGHNDDDDENESSESIWCRDSSLTSISCRQNQITDAGIEKFSYGIMDYLKQRDQVEDDDDDDVDDDEDNADPLTGPSHHSIRLDSLDFGSNVITDLGVQVLSALLARNPTIKSLGLDGNFITDSGVAHLKEIIADDKHRQLTTINLANNQLTSIGVNFIVHALNEGDNKQTPESSMRKQLNLDLSNNNVGVDGIASLLTIQSRGVPAAHFTQLSLSLFDEDVIDSRLENMKLSHLPPQSSPRPVAKHRPSPPAVATISTSQQNVLSLFSPIASSTTTNVTYSTASNHNMLDLFGLTHNDTNAGTSSTTTSSVNSAVSSTIESIPPQSQHLSQSSSTPNTPSSESVSTPTSGKKKSRRRDKRAPANDPLAPKISIRTTPSRPRASVTPLQPPPEFVPPTPSPEPCHSSPFNETPNHPISHHQTPGTPAVYTPASNATPIINDADESTQRLK